MKQEITDEQYKDLYKEGMDAARQVYWDWCYSHHYGVVINPKIKNHFAPQLMDIGRMIQFLYEHIPQGSHNSRLFERDAAGNFFLGHAFKDKEHYHELVDCLWQGVKEICEKKAA